MVGIFSRFSIRGNSHRRTQSALDQRVPLTPIPEVTAGPTTLASSASADAAAAHSIEIAAEFKPVERPSEPLDNDQPVQCPLPEPSILNDGRIWKERVSSSGVVQRRGADTRVETESVTRKARPNNRVILPSVSAPEHNILKLLEECNASGI